jgi:hypothetical protein
MAITKDDNDNGNLPREEFGCIEDVNPTILENNDDKNNANRSPIVVPTDLGEMECHEGNTDLQPKPEQIENETKSVTISKTNQDDVPASSGTVDSNQQEEDPVIEELAEKEAELDNLPSPDKENSEIVSNKRSSSVDITEEQSNAKKLTPEKDDVVLDDHVQNDAILEEHVENSDPSNKRPNTTDQLA